MWCRGGNRTRVDSGVFCGLNPMLGVTLPLAWLSESRTLVVDCLREGANRASSVRPRNTVREPRQRLVRANEGTASSIRHLGSGTSTLHPHWTGS